jgi:hypothetical protein
VRLLLFLLGSLALTLIAPASRAQSAPQIQIELDQDTAGVGDVVQIEMSVTSTEAMPSDPRLGPSPGFIVRGQNASPTQMHMVINGVVSNRYTLSVTWALQAQQPGTYGIGPPTVSVGGQRYSARGIKLQVVPAGQGPARRQRPSRPQSPFGFSPFDPWRSLIPGFDPMDQAPPPPVVAPTPDPKLALDPPRGATYFLHATVDKTAAAVGEQVTFDVYEYLDVSATDVAIDDDARDAQVPDFVKRPLMREDQDAVLVGYASMVGHTWIVKRVRRWALFPLRAGDLVIAPMRETLIRPRALAGQPRTTEEIHVQVTEPPLAGRPAGYAVGDVGRFALAAQVQPRQVEQGGAVAVHVELSGTGNLPGALTPGAREGVEWLTPEVHEEMGPAGKDVYGGKRTFDFVVRMKQPGALDLGTLALPYWDPEARRYETARAALGVVQVTSAPGAVATAEPEQPLLQGLPGPRDALQGSPEARRHADDTALFWLGGVAGWPLAFGLVVAGGAASRRAAGAWRSRRTSPAADLKERVALAHVACEGKDARLADAAIARALEAAIVAHAGVSVRAAVGGEIVDRLERAGVVRETASRVADLMRECEAARFSPDDANLDGARSAARDRWIRAQGAIRGLEKRA